MLTFLAPALGVLPYSKLELSKSSEAATQPHSSSVGACFRRLHPARTDTVRVSQRFQCLCEPRVMSCVFAAAHVWLDFITLFALCPWLPCFLPGSNDYLRVYWERGGEIEWEWKYNGVRERWGSAGVIQILQSSCLRSLVSIWTQRAHTKTLRLSATVQLGF